MLIDICLAVRAGEREAARVPCPSAVVTSSKASLQRVFDRRAAADEIRLK